MLLRIADSLIPATGQNPKPSDVEDYVVFLQLALSARVDVFDTVMAAVGRLAAVPKAEMWQTLKQLWRDDRAVFDPLSSVVAGAYFMTPQVKTLIGYPGQRRDPAPISLAADEIGSGLLDPVIERGSIYVSTTGE